MKIIAIVISLACFSHGVLVAEEPSPSPTPDFRRHAPHPGPVRRLNYIERRHESEARVEASEAKAQAQVNRRSADAAQAQSKAASRARTQAQRQVAAETRIEAKNATPHANSELMSRMGFSEQEIAAQKAREQSERPGGKEAKESTLQEARRPETSPPVVETGAADQQSTVSHAKAVGAATQKPTSASSATDPDSH